MKAFVSIIAALLFSATAFTQQPSDTIAATIVLPDTTNAPNKDLFLGFINLKSSDTYNKKRVRLVTIGNFAGYGVAMAGLYSAWYSNYQQGSFHFFDDNNEWKQVDKVGHAYGAYIES